jgi:hypothetical protein
VAMPLHLVLVSRTEFALAEQTLSALLHICCGRHRHRDGEREGYPDPKPNVTGTGE